ncbi:MerR family transcriptional regulator [Novosphingobium sediminicola]|uniref:DNA-binding transcriptional MerR regulator n=1 Tax=Novosphingobium sediminicola TaxID=563162 RepID=A0A7W6CGW4_9SPHN|nr:MerR family transcriptional regulator [Novosphingobium sediminicola]MBB3956298.1 DNA-binding transcriptional MerR regulator [Novosphingobium sediminicola]
MHDAYPTNLFSRQQIAEITGLDDSTLNYWMREGVLRAAEGGTGRGSHRKFTYCEATLAGILNELHHFGIGVKAMAQLASRFHDAVDWMAERAIDIHNLGRIVEASQIRREIIEKGCSTVTYGRSEIIPEHANLLVHRDNYGAWVELDWDQAIAYQFRNRKKSQLSQKEKDLVFSWDSVEAIRKFNRHLDYFEAIAEIELRPPGYLDVQGSTLIGRNEDGEWEIFSREIGDATPISYIGIDIRTLTYRMWSPLLGSVVQ